MQIAIDISPLRTGHHLQHAVRGTGFYLTNLLESLKKYVPDNSYVEFVRGEKIPPGVEVIHYPYFEPFFLTLPFFPQKNVVVTVHDVTPLKFPDLFPAGKKGRVKWELQKRSLQKVAKIITDSESSKKDIHTIIGVEKERIEVVYLAASEIYQKMQLSKKEIAEIKEKYHLPDSFALYVGDATPNKNLPVLIQATKQAKIPLVLVGKALASDEYDKNHPWNKDLAEVQRTTEDDQLFHLLGFVPNEDLVKLYNIASVFVMPSFYEGFGLPLIEAMSCGTPVITTRESSLPEVAEEAAIYVDHTSSEELAGAIKKVVENSSLAHALSEKSLKQANNFSWQKTALATDAVYRSIIK